MKTYLPNETKAERKARKARERAGLLSVDNTNKNYIVCLKWGNKYSHEYVNTLYNMVQRHTTVEHEFVCFTENPEKINQDIRTEILPQLPTQGWWYKPYFLSNELPFKGTLLFLDLDVVICNNIDKLFSYEPDKFCIIRDFNRSIRQSWDKMNSSVFRTPIGKYNSLWNDYRQNIKLHTIKNRGDQDWMYRHIKDHVFWPDDWIQSYKWEMRDRSALKIINGKRNFINNDSPKVNPNTSIAVFHGDPNPSECSDSWVKQHWK